MDVNVGNGKDADLVDRAERFESPEFAGADRVAVVRIDGLADEIVRREERQSVAPTGQAELVCVERDGVNFLVAGRKSTMTTGAGGGGRMFRVEASVGFTGGPRTRGP